MNKDYQVMMKRTKRPFENDADFWSDPEKYIIV